jgi:hypothetical protein
MLGYCGVTLLGCVIACIALKRCKLPNRMLRSERISSFVKMMLKVMNTAYFYVGFIHILHNICNLAIKFFAKKKK